MCLPTLLKRKYERTGTRRDMGKGKRAFHRSQSQLFIRAKSINLIFIPRCVALWSLCLYSFTIPNYLLETEPMPRTAAEPMRAFAVTTAGDFMNEGAIL